MRVLLRGPGSLIAFPRLCYTHHSSPLILKSLIHIAVSSYRSPTGGPLCVGVCVCVFANVIDCTVTIATVWFFFLFFFFGWAIVGAFAVVRACDMGI